jgi:hypothetical protein
LIFLFLSDLSSRSILLSVRFCSSFPAPRLRFVFPISFHRCWDLLNFRCQVFFPLWLLFPAQSAFDLCPWFPPVRRDRRAGRSDHFTTQPSPALIFFGSDPQPPSCSACARWFRVFLLPSAFFRCQFSARRSSAPVAPQDRSPFSVLSVPSAGSLFCP